MIPPSDKRRVNSKEELRRLFQMSAQFHADELPTKAGSDKLDRLRFRDFLKSFYKQNIPESSAAFERLLRNLNLATDDGRLNLAGVLLFAEQPEWIVPQFVIKAVRNPGNEIHVSKYLDSEDFTGSLSKMFDDALAFILRNLHKVQAGRGVNTPGIAEIPPLVFEELLVNALIHRDYLVSAPIRLFIFDNRIEIISPGHLPDNLTVEKIRLGNSIIRNPILVSYAAKGILPYRGLGSGIKRALEAWPEIDFTDDRDGCLFTVTVHRKEFDSSEIIRALPANSGQVPVKKDETATVFPNPPAEGSEKSSEKIMALVRKDPKLSAREIAGKIGISPRAVEKQIAALKKAGRLCRVGPAKGGHWEIIE